MLFLFLLTFKADISEAQEVFNLNFKEMELKEAFRILAQTTNENIATHSSVEGEEVYS